jgi:hypothetical protein
MSESFKGFDVPQQNWFKLPNEWTDIMHGMTSMSEMKIVLYILRHTWGFHEYGQSKKITLDEFIHGRMKKDGIRMDHGTGLSQSSVTDGLRRAADHGYLIVEIDDNDKGRIKKFYTPRMSKTAPKDLMARSLSVREGSLSVRDRTEKETNKKEKKNTMSEAAASDLVSNSSKKKTEPTDWDYRAVDELNKVISSVVKVNKRMDRKKWAGVFRTMRTTDGIPKREIGETIKWYSTHIGGEYDVQAFSAQSFRDKWEKLVAARWKDKIKGGSRIVSDMGRKTDAHKQKMALRKKVFAWLIEEGFLNDWEPASPSMLKDALEALGEKSDALTTTFVNSGGSEE